MERIALASKYAFIFSVFFFLGAFGYYAVDRDQQAPRFPMSLLSTLNFTGVVPNPCLAETCASHGLYESRPFSFRAIVDIEPKLAEIPVGQGFRITLKLALDKILTSNEQLISVWQGDPSFRPAQSVSYIDAVSSIEYWDMISLAYVLDFAGLTFAPTEPVSIHPETGIEWIFEPADAPGVFVGSIRPIEFWSDELDGGIVNPDALRFQIRIVDPNWFWNIYGWPLVLQIAGTSLAVTAVFYILSLFGIRKTGGEPH